MTDEALLAQLERSRALGFLGPGPVEEHVRHAAGFLAALEGVSGRLIDLGSGGGVPGLIIGRARPDLELVLLDAMGKRCRFLEAAVRALELQASVVEGRAESVGRGPLRASAEVVVARSFGRPAATAECAAPLLRPGGLLLVSEPPDTPERWPADGLQLVGMTPLDRLPDAPTVQRIVLTAPCDERFPRRDGVPAKRPLF